MPAITALEARDMIHDAASRNVSKLIDEFFDEVAIPQFMAGNSHINGILVVPMADTSELSEKVAKNLSGSIADYLTDLGYQVESVTVGLVGMDCVQYKVEFKVP